MDASEQTPSSSSKRFQIATAAAFGLIGLWVVIGLSVPASKWWPFLVLPVIAVYGVLAWVWEHKNCHLLSHYSESAYFMGYLSTIAGLVVIAVTQRESFR